MAAPAPLPLRGAAARVCLLIILFFLQTLLGLCYMTELTTYTHAADAHTAVETNKAASEAKHLLPTSPARSENLHAYPWDATCAAYKSLSVKFPEARAQATYDLRQLVDGAPQNGWTCKANEPLFGIYQYPPFFRSLFSILLGPEEESKKDQNIPNELHQHKDKHVFFAFNPCRLLPHSCRGSPGRLFKFAAKLKNPTDPDEEIDRLLSTFLKLPPPGTATKAEEVADTTECLQNVLPTNTTSLYSHHYESLQQHPSSNGLGGLWADPHISDDPTPWEPLDPQDPHKGLQTNMRHTHIFCQDSFLHTQIELRCPSTTRGSTKFEICEHVNPCLFRMVLTSDAACPSSIQYAGSASDASHFLGAAGAGSSALKRTWAKDEVSLVEGEQRKHDTDKDTKSALSSGGYAVLFTEAFAGGSDAGGASHATAKESSLWQSSWPKFSFFLILALRVALCLLVFAWMIYAVRDWTQTKMQYAPLPEEKKADVVPISTQVNSYDSCVEALVDAPGTSRTDEASSCELASPISAASTASHLESKPSRYHAPRRELRGLFSSPGRRFVSVWLPNVLDAAAQQAHGFAVAAHGACGKVASAIASKIHQPMEFPSAQAHAGNDAMRWDWTDAIDLADSNEPTPTTPRNVPVLGRNGYETI